MKNTPRKLTRFYIINPVGDRRLEKRFDSRENVAIRLASDNRIGPAMAFEVGQNGLRLATLLALDVGTELEVVFPNSPDRISCFGRVVWVKPLADQKEYTVGVLIDAWHGIVSGENSWMTYKGSFTKIDRRQRPR